MPQRLLQEVLPKFWWLILNIVFFITILSTSGLKWHWVSFKFRFFQWNQTGNSNFNQKSGPIFEATKSTYWHVHLLLWMLNLLKLYSFDPVNDPVNLIFPMNTELLENHPKQEFFSQFFTDWILPQVSVEWGLCRPGTDALGEYDTWAKKCGFVIVSYWHIEEKTGRKGEMSLVVYINWISKCFKYLMVSVIWSETLK
jgi:hypothetical protein